MPTQQDLTAQLKKAQDSLNSVTVKNVQLPTSTANPVSQAQPSTALTNLSVKLANVPPVIPASSLKGDTTMSDVYAKRNSIDSGIQSFNGFMQQANAPISGTPISNPDAYINNLLLNRPTDTQNSLDATMQKQSKQTTNFANDYKTAGTKAEQQYGLSGLEASLAETRTKIADRTTKLRQDLRNFETNANVRGVDRQFADSAKQKLQADAAAELADLSIIENAQQGNVTAAQAEVDRVLKNKMDTYTLQNAAIEQEIARLTAMDTRESKTRAEQLQVALDTRKQNQDKATADEKTRLDYMTQAAANGADTQTLDAIRMAKTPGEAALLAGPYIGRLDRQMQQSQMYTQSLQQQKLLAELNPTGDTSVNQDIAAYGQQYAETGTLPSPSALKESGITAAQVTEYARQTPKADGAILSTNTGIKPKTLSAKQEEGISAMNEIVQNTLPALKDRFGKIATGVLGGLGGKVWTSQDRQDYLTFRAEFLSKLLVARSGAAVTEQEYARYADMLPGEFNQIFFLGTDGMKKLNSLESSMKTNLDNSLNTTQTVIQGYSKVNVPGIGQKTVGEHLDFNGVTYRVLPDGLLTDVI